MKLSKREYLKSIGIGTAATALAGCMGGGGDSGSSELQAASWASGEEQEIVTGLIQDFEDETGIAAIHENVPYDEYMNTLQVQFSGGEEPDVFYLADEESPGLMEQGALLDLEELRDDSEFALDDIWDPVLNTFVSDGSLYGVPKDYTTVGYFYNEEMFSNAGYDTFPETWADFRSALETINEQADVTYPAGIGARPRESLLQLVWSHGGRVLNEDETEAVIGSDEAIQGLERLVSLREDGLLGYWNDDLSAPDPMVGLGEGDVAVGWIGAWGTATLDADYSDMPINVADHVPVPDGGTSATILITTAWSASSATDREEDTLELLKYLTNDEGMWAWAQEGIALSARESHLEKEFYQENPRMANLVNLTEDARPRVFGRHSGEIMNRIMSEAEGALTGAQSAREAFESAEEIINNEILN
ncbi:extracellular solute-binding protein (plasmid) [Haloterrigena salifodinae]|uniref:Extracellular solute-binding protein n=1 Tax=Haloterrigena salifodinae TaxID=2675099 RepID=A0A8T8E7E3_9EURY|nr:extracellular solute-binding protein [Haloterrigena salifodinae]QRV17400.1 extracellular solute-binding protein [Haloterrigena salifodinae]